MALPITSQLGYSLHSSVRGALRQLKYGIRDNSVLCTGISQLLGRRPRSNHVPLQLSLSFSLPPTAARIDLARVTHLCRRLFFKKPSYMFRSTGYVVCATFSGLLLDELVSFFLGMRHYSRTKFLKFFASEVQLGFTLAEPLTFFPLVHAAFDYYDWRMPFVFNLSRTVPVGPDADLDWYAATRLLSLYFLLFVLNFPRRSHLENGKNYS
jgi:hypothetical protein